MENKIVSRVQFGKNAKHVAEAALYHGSTTPHETAFAEQVVTFIANADEVGRNPRELHIVAMGDDTGDLRAAFHELGCNATFSEPTHMTDADHYADAIVFSDATNWLDDAVLPEIRRILKPGGQIASFVHVWSYESEITAEMQELLQKEYRDVPAGLVRNGLPDISKRLGHRLMDESSWYGYSFVKEYTRKELVDYFKCAAPSIVINETSLRSNVIEPAWDFANDNGFLLEDGRLKVTYDVSGVYGVPKRRSAGAERAMVANDNRPPSMRENKKNLPDQTGTPQHGKNEGKLLGVAE